MPSSNLRFLWTLPRFLKSLMGVFFFALPRFNVLGTTSIKEEGICSYHQELGAHFPQLGVVLALE